MLGGAARPRPASRASVVVASLGAALLAALSGVISPAIAESAPPAPDAPPPVTGQDFPDPFVLRAGNDYFAFATNSLANVPLLHSGDLRHWQTAGDALPSLGSWAVPGHTWAPAVLWRWPAYVLFYTAKDRASGRQCIGRAVSSVPQGPYVDSNSQPILCQVARGGSIDASPFVDDDNRPYLYWKSEGVAGREPTRIWAAPLSNDGLSLAGPGRELLRTDRAWEGPIIEAPSMVREGGRYVLFYSGNRWESSSYAIGWASCARPTGPCSKAAGPLLTSRAGAEGPGGQETFRDPGGRLWFAYHAWSAPRIGYPHGARTLRLLRLSVRNGVPALSR